jgi:hypothetical protein
MAARTIDLAPSIGGTRVMLDLDAHARFTDATAELMRSCAVAAAQTMTVSACRSLTLWSDLLRTPAERRVSQPSRPVGANPFEAFWRFSSIDWMPKSAVWPQSNWLSSYTSALGWSPYAAWGSAPYTAWPTLSDWSTWSRLYWPSWSGQSAYASVFTLPEAMTHAALRATSPSGYASYRSAGGHAVAQVIMPGSNAAVASMRTTVALTQMQAMLSVWRAALGA